MTHYIDWLPLQRRPNDAPTTPRHIERNVGTAWRRSEVEMSSPWQEILDCVWSLPLPHCARTDGWVVFIKIKATSTLLPSAFCFLPSYSLHASPTKGISKHIYALSHRFGIGRMPFKLD